VPDASSWVDDERSAPRRGDSILPSGTGLLGGGIGDMLLFSIVTTAAMVGLSSGDCCTQRRPICTHLSNSNRSSGFGCATFESRSSLIVPWFQDSQACETQLQKFMIVQQEGKERMPCRFSMVPSRWAHIRKEHWRGSVPLTTDYLE
jgi:hypothetical protein